MIESTHLLPAVCLTDESKAKIDTLGLRRSVSYGPPAFIHPDSVYLVMGEVAVEVSERGSEAKLTGTRRYVLLDIDLGVALRGTYPAEWFRYVNETDPKQP